MNAKKGPDVGGVGASGDEKKTQRSTRIKSHLSVQAQPDNAGVITTLESSNSLADLAARIQQEHEAVCLAARSTLEHAFRAGQLLIEAKELVDHGHWSDWLHQHCDLSERSAQKYMQLARNRIAFEANAPGTADLTIDQALRSLAKPKPPVEIDADYFVVPSADYLPSTDGKTRIGILSGYGYWEMFGVRADPRHPDYFQIVQMEGYGGEDGAGMWCETTGGRPVRADFVKEFLQAMMRRPDRFDDIEWDDHDGWPFPEPKPRWPAFKDGGAAP